MKNKTVKIIKIDVSLSRYTVMELLVPESVTIENSKVLKAICNVGDFIEIDGKLYRRVKGGFKEANEDDMAMFLTAMLGN